jgi:rod shape-determining protein MreC
MKRTSSRSLFALTLILLAVGLMVLSLAGYLRPIQGLLLRPLAGAQDWLAVRVAAVRDMLASPADVALLRQRVSELETENSRLQQDVISLREQLAEVEILSALLNYARTQPESRYVAADVIGRDISPFLRSVMIGRGSDSGIARGMPVVTERGLVGRVTEVFATVSRVQLITDPEAAVNVLLQSSRGDGVLVPQLNGELWIDLIDQSVTVTPGETILTSGLGGLFPPEVAIGQVISVRKRDFELFQQAVIQPSVDFDRLQIVLIITNFSSPTNSGATP